MKMLSVCLFVLSLAMPGLAQLNNCAHPYWAHSLRCQAFPGLVPQANLGSVPTAAQVKPFTRVFLNADPSVRCADGTRPIMYVDKAVGAGSNNWIFSMTGGGSVAGVDTNGDGIVDDAQNVVDTYADPGERDEMGTALKPPMKDLDGINDPNPLRNPTFSAYNRVRIEKCSYDRYMGRVAYESPAGFFNELSPAGAAVSFNLYQQGYLIMQEALEALQPGLPYTTWSVDAAGRVVASQETLPALTAAQKVLFVGHSGAAHGLFHNIDNLAALLATMPDFTGDVRALFDANFLPSNENEPWFDSATPGVNDAYSAVWSGQTAAAGNTFTYDGSLYWPSSLLHQQYTS